MIYSFHIIFKLWFSRGGSIQFAGYYYFRRVVNFNYYTNKQYKDTI